VIRENTFAAQQNIKPSIPEAPPFCSKIAEALPQRPHHPLAEERVDKPSDHNLRRHRLYVE
jgi:hypothetical protein